MPLPRALPVADELIADYLRSTLGDPVTVEHVPTSDMYGRTPYVLVRSTSSGDTPHWRLLDHPVLDVECWGSPTKRDAADLAEACRLALHAAPLALDDRAALSHVRQVSYPYEIRENGQPGGIYHYTATYQVLIRPR